MDIQDLMRQWEAAADADAADGAGQLRRAFDAGWSAGLMRAPTGRAWSDFTEAEDRRPSALRAMEDRMERDARVAREAWEWEKYLALKEKYESASPMPRRPRAG